MHLTLSRSDSDQRQPSTQIARQVDGSEALIDFRLLGRTFAEGIDAFCCTLPLRFNCFVYTMY
jgi:hypothetical protein